MKKNLRNGWPLVVFTIVIATGCRFYFDKTKDNFTVSPGNQSLVNGKNLTYNICAGCHYDPALQKFSGKQLNDLPKIAGTLYSANITHSVTNGTTTAYSDAELFYLLKTGIARNGKFMPYMMRPMMADEDVNDIITYLHSNDEAVAAADTTVGTSHINLIGRWGLRLGARPQPYNKGVPRPDEHDAVNYGRYLVAVTGCYHCHSKKALQVDFMTPEKSASYMQGGMKLKDPNGNRIFGPNLTPDKETGIGNFTQADFSNAVTRGVTPAGRKLSPPMPVYKHLTAAQVDALYAYLHTLQPVHHKVKRPAA